MVVKQFAGHVELSTTQRYAHMVASDLGAAIALLSVREASRSGERGQRLFHTLPFRSRLES